MKRYKILIVFSLILTTLFGKEEIFISPKIALKMVDKNNVLFISLDESNLVIKRGKKFDHKFLTNFDILGKLDCEDLYICANKVESYLSKLGIQASDTLILHDNRYGIDASTLYTVLESVGHKNIAILRGDLKDILDLDPNWDNYQKYVYDMKNIELSMHKDMNKTRTEVSKDKVQSLENKIQLLKPHLLVELSNMKVQNENNSSYEMGTMNRKYLQSKNEFSAVVANSLKEDKNATIVDVCSLEYGLFDKNSSGKQNFLSFSWKALIDKEKRVLKSNEELRNIFARLELRQTKENYLHCMSGAQKAFFVMLALREVGYTKVKAFIGDWNVWIGDIDE